MSESKGLEDNGDFGVYAILNPINQIYVGSTTSFKRRFYQYKSLYEKSQKKLYNSFIKYGVEKHKFIILERCPPEKLCERERYWGEFFNALDKDKGLNSILPGYDDKKAILSQEAKLKISKANKCKKLSEATKYKISIANKGKKQTQEHINKRKLFGARNPMYGKESSFKGHNHTAEARQQMSVARKGKHLLGENSNAKKVLDKEKGYIYNSAKEVAIKFNINYSTLKSWLQGRNKGGGRFEYVNF